MKIKGKVKAKQEVGGKDFFYFLFFEFPESISGRHFIKVGSTWQNGGVIRKRHNCLKRWEM